MSWSGMSNLDSNTLLQMNAVAQAGIALLFAAILHSYMQRPAAPAGLGGWSAGMFWLILLELGELLTLRVEAPEPLLLTMVTMVGAWLHASLIALGTVEFALFRTVERRIQVAVVATAVGLACTTTLASHFAAPSHQPFLQTGLHACLAAIALPASAAFLLRRSPRPWSFGCWLFGVGSILFAVQSLRYTWHTLLRYSENGSHLYLGFLDPCIHAALGAAMVILLLDRFWASSLHSAEALRQREEELRQAHRLESVATLAGGVAHEYNNLLTAIVGHADFLTDAVRGNSVATADVEAIRSATHRATMLTRQLLTFSRSQELNPQPEQLNVILSEMSRTLQRTVGDYTELALRLVPNLPLVNLDRSQFELALMNLAINTRDALQEGTAQGAPCRLEVRTMAVEIRDRSIPTGLRLTPGQYVVVQFADNGKGMDEETRARALEPFFSTKDEIANKEHGLLPGLGLSSVYGIVRQSGGDVLLSSRPGKGTTITLYLPTTDQQKPTALAPLPPVARPSAPRSTQTILVVDDDRAVAGLAMRALKDAGFRVLMARNGVDALLMAQRYIGRIDLLVTDLVMPGMSGEALARALQSQQESMTTLYVSGYSAEDLLQRGLPDPGPHVLAKPFTPEDLTQKVRAILGS